MALAYTASCRNAPAAYTPSAAAARLAEAGAALPLWWAGEGDTVHSPAIADKQFIATMERFGLRAVPSRHSTGFCRPRPWGWSFYSRAILAKAGVPDACLPSDSELIDIQKLSHRRTASLLASKLARRLPYEIPEPAVEVADEQSLTALIQNRETGQEYYFKAPWSSSGRGVASTASQTDVETIRRCLGIIRRQGSVMFEQALNRVADFAMLFDADGNGLAYRGLSLFTTKGGAYSGNLVEPQSNLRSRLAKLLPEVDLELVAEAVRRSLEEIIDGRYKGPLGVDMMVWRNKSDISAIAPAVEINLRRTMGFVALDLANRFCPEGSNRCGIFRVLPSAGEVSTGNEEGAAIELTPRNPYFTFRLEMSDSGVNNIL